MDKKKKIGLIVLLGIIIIMLLLFVGIEYKQKGENKDIDVVNSISIYPVKDSKMIKFYEKVEGYINIYDYKNEEVISTYECQNEECGVCDAYTVCSGATLNDLGKITIFDYNENEVSSSFDGKFNPSKLILFDAINGKKISEYNDIISSYSLKSNSGSTKYIILVNKDNQTAIVDLNDNYLKNYSNKKYVISSYEGQWVSSSSYLTENDMIVTIDNDKYGIERITEDKVLINHDYDEIMLCDIVNYQNSDLYASKYFKARNGNKWSLYSLDKGTRVIENDFNKIYLLSENVIVVYNDGYITFIDYDGNNIINDKIEVSNLFESMPNLPEGISFTYNDNTVEILISDGTNYDNRVISRYEYNLDTNNLSKLS